ncbi:GNAT family N-acetyltransferase [Nocardioides sp. cx-173]|uniref:GNAT family N-acetyltransferase n=1 Tax=Nocardioides sp. cx-173 TaxID=2898796 RepID=UPI001E4F021A|nr:GNAT family protein [Nocardioides sp. cx-173]MCD4527233.1 GNAT family N-acetyltransferase [Nocardioides sp. cx-173]UGB40388.1 GNAT family N-acetyltransferase [Nocardioides sp. cx-173]
MLDDAAVIPTGLRHERFVMTPLTADTAAVDYACYMASPDVIRTHSDGRWPGQGFSFSDDLELVAQHEDDHKRRHAFTYVILTPSGTEALGCLYMNPLREYLIRAEAPGHLVDQTPLDTAMVTFWLRQDQQDTGLAEVVVKAVNDWILDEWPLAGHLFRVLPGERSSCVALDRLGLQRVRLDLSGDERPYIWYRRSA